ncbi:MAG: 16S rRNA (cytosine(967)-C(5))-methyltransferase RsmB [Acetatifactor sp.]|nr:16S rRNA (cytosine(967)-C(5))-methyltransferase RsmB [Acetatifactor sp.]
MTENIREIALDTMLTLEQQMEYSNHLIRAVLDKYDYLSGRDKAFLKRLTEGTLERRLELDYYLNKVSTVPVGKMKPLIRELLRISLYQMLYMDAVPDSAICNEACKIVEKRGFGGLRGFVNGVLRNLARQKECLPLPDREKEPMRYLSVKYSMPDWIVDTWVDEYGIEITETLLEGLMRVHPVSLRFRTDLPLERQKEWCNELREQGMTLQQSSYLPYVYTLEGAQGVNGLPGFDQGLFTVQDVSSALAVEAAGIRKEDFVIDVCAAPGGKSMLAAEKAARVLSRDRTENKAELLRDTARRMRAENIQVQVYDGRATDETLIRQADVVLLDVPCSGLGVIGKKRDIKYRASRESVREMTVLQKEIVNSSWQYVKPGGTLLYSTCTISVMENEAMVKYISEELPFEPVPLDRLPGKILALREQFEELRKKNGKPSWPGLNEDQRRACVQLLPGYTEGDGFFIALFKRKG